MSNRIGNNRAIRIENFDFIPKFTKYCHVLEYITKEDVNRE